MSKTKNILFYIIITLLLFLTVKCFIQYFILLSKVPILPASDLYLLYFDTPEVLDFLFEKQYPQHLKDLFDSYVSLSISSLVYSVIVIVLRNLNKKKQFLNNKQNDFLFVHTLLSILSLIIGWSIFSAMGFGGIFPISSNQPNIIKTSNDKLTNNELITKNKLETCVLSLNWPLAPKGIDHTLLTPEKIKQFQACMRD